MNTNHSQQTSADDRRPSQPVSTQQAYWRDPFRGPRMFRLHTSNDAARLADALGERLHASRGHPLVPARVLVPQAGLKRWLQVHLAERFGVVANVEFTPPAQFTWELLRATRPDLPRHSPFDVEVLRWHLYVLLGERLDGAALAPLREYLESGGDPLRRYALSFELARVYERMQGYRRDTLLAWERGDGADDWQAELWRRLLPRVGGLSRAARVDEWLRAFDPEYPPGSFSEKPAPPGLPDAFACFACANVSPDVLRMLAVAGRHCEVDFHLPLPSRGYLGDTPRSRREVRARLLEKDGGNPLITSLGGAAAEFVELLYGYEHVQPDEESDLFDQHIARTTLLGRVRDDILEHRAARGDERVALPDDSMQFHACHTPLREVQTLHDRLLAMFAADPSLKPRDVAVMMPDVAAYRPAIEAVFGGVPEHDARFIPYNLGDLAASAAHPAVRLFLALLDAPASRWECSEIVDVLAVPGVMRRLDLDASQREQLSQQLRESGVRWGEDEHARAAVGGYREFSFAFGLDRMLAGFACGEADETLVAGVAPLPGIEGAAFARMDALLAMLAAWRTLREWSSRALEPAEWQRRLNALFDGLYAGDPDDIAETRALERVRRALSELVEHAGAASVQALPWHDLRAFLREHLDRPDQRQQLFAGGVTFCGMVPLRVVPFRVICLLGMGEASFPRRDPSGLDPLSADRRAGRARRGDRSVRDDDRLLFLQLLAAAGDAFYLSWIGRDAHTNESLAPSVAVAELMDAVREGYLSQDEAARDAQHALLPRVQPLHPFDASLFDARAPRSFRKEWLAAAGTLETGYASGPFVPDALPQQAATLPTAALSLDALRRFLLDPARGFLEQGLGLVLPRDRDDPDDEPLSPTDGLTRWSLTRALLDFGDGNASGQRDLLRARGQLPPGALGDEALRDAHVLADALRSEVLAFTQGAAPLPTTTLRVDGDDGMSLEGAPVDRYPAGVLHVRPGVIDGRHVLRAWLDALLCAAAGVDGPVVLIGLDKDKQARSFALPRLAQAEAREQLLAFIELHHEGRRAPLPFFVRTSWNHALSCAQRERKGGNAPVGIDITMFERAARDADTESTFGGPNEFESDAVCIAWRGRDLPGPADGELARALHRTALAVFAQPARAWAEQFK
ncbi:MAG: Exodeoxyribonuclease V gamma chain [Rhodanobacteraceae bacterium]|nr:MAG: Exodeoxyribonuclease V gamma chain [Rhodanobacteraceae bacterium]